MNISFNEKLVAYLVLFCGLSVSAVAVYYSVVGLTAIFAASAIAVIIMGTVLEISKLVATVWLKQYWSVTPKLIKYYLIIAILLLMVITSMGIFGFLSRAHINQTTNTQENQAQITRLQSEIARQEELIQRSESRIQQIEAGNTGQDAQIQRQIDQEQARIDSVLKRIEPSIQEQNNIISSRSQFYQEYRDRITQIDQDLTRLQNNLNNKNITEAQAQVGAQPDGQFGPKTQAAIGDYQQRLTQQKNQAMEVLEQSARDSVIVAARNEIQRVRTAAEQQINQSNQLIDRLRSQLGKSQSLNVDQQVDQLRSTVTVARQEIEKLSRDKFQIEGQVRQLEAELGPIKYIANFVYGDKTNRDLLEKSVSWMIILLILVFDPLAVILLLASQVSFQHLRQQNSPSLSVNGDHNFDIKNHSYLFKPWTHFKTGQKNYTASTNKTTPDDHEILLKDSNLNKISELTVDQHSEFEDNESLEEKEAQRLWKQINPDKTLKDQRDKYNVGILKELPWQQLITPLHVVQFGREFPAQATVGCLFCRTDLRPTVIYKFFNSIWLEIEDSHKSYYTFGDEYIDWLINEIGQNNYDQSLLTENEKQSIKNKLIQ
jgi:hypothetical protein